MKIAILQKVNPLYRVEFFQGISKKVDVTLYLYEKASAGDVEECKGVKSKHIRNFKIKSILCYSIIPLLFGGYDTLVLMLHQGHISTWFLLLTRFIHRKKIILWGQGISVKRYLEEEKKVNWILKLMIKMSNGCWLYMPKEKAQWEKILKNKPLVALGNTLSGIKKMTEYESSMSKDLLKQKYEIKEEIIFIYCARFNTLNRRTDLLEDVIKRIDNKKYGFIIIGEGKFKPDFTKYNNVYDFGRVYENEKKEDLFSISDAYFQPAWLGLSIVESMARSNAVFTFKRTKDTMQGVELDYIKDGYNGLLFDSAEDAVKKINDLSKEKIAEMGRNARQYIKNNALIDNMVNNAIMLLEKVNKKI